MRAGIKKVLALGASNRPAHGATLLIYHRVGGASMDELDVSTSAFARQLDLLADVDCRSLDDALDQLDEGDERPTFVVTFDDGFADVYRNAWPLLRDRAIPFTLYLATAYVGESMRWDGSTSKGTGAPGVTWPQVAEMVDSGLCTVGNHTHRHARPEQLDEAEVDACSAEVERHLGFAPRHFAYTWGVAVPRMEEALRARFRSAATGELGRNPLGVDRVRLRRVPVRRTDPAAFFAAKLVGDLGPERAYAGMVAVAKRVGVRG